MTKILVIEDEQPILDNIIQILEFEAYEPIAANNGQIGIELAHQHHPDLILCDIMMSPVDGYQVLMALRGEQTTAMIPFIFLTARAERADVRYGMELGADDYLTKPFSPQELVTAIQTRLDKHTVLTKAYEKKVDDVRGSIFHMLPHELRTPLVAILGYSDLLIEDGLTLPGERVVSMAKAISQAGRRLHRLTENFLLYAQIELFAADSQQVQEFRSYGIDDADWHVSRTARQQAEDAGRDGDLMLDMAVVQPVRVVEDSIKKITTELVDNALKFSDAGTPVRVATYVENAHYVLRVQDFGRGMTPEQIASVGAGMQFDRALYEQQGTGLGLAIARRLVDLHAGDMQIESIPGQQTIVRVRLPLHPGV